MFHNAVRSMYQCDINDCPSSEVVVVVFQGQLYTRIPNLSDPPIGQPYADATS